MSTESRELPELQDIIASMRNFAAVADTCQLTEGNAPAAIGVWADMLEALAHSRAQGGGWEMVAIVCERGTVSWRAERILPVGTKLYTAAEQPAKGEGVDVEATDMGTYTDYAFQQPSDPADAVCDCGSSVDNRQPHHDECAIYATPPTAQRHDEGERTEALRACLAYFEARENIGDEPNEETEIAAWLRSILAHGAGAAVEAVAHAIRLLEWTVAEHVYDAETEADFNRAIRGLESLPPQQRREQVAGGGGVDALPAKWRQRADSMWASYGGECRRCANELEAALSTQPLLSDQPGGVSAGDASALHEIARSMRTRYAAPAGDGPSSDTISRNAFDVAFMLSNWADRIEAALHPEQAKDGDV